MWDARNGTSWQYSLQYPRNNHGLMVTDMEGQISSVGNGRAR